MHHRTGVAVIVAQEVMHRHVRNDRLGIDDGSVALVHRLQGGDQAGHVLIGDIGLGVVEDVGIAGGIVVGIDQLHIAAAHAEHAAAASSLTGGGIHAVVFGSSAVTRGFAAAGVLALGTVAAAVGTIFGSSIGRGCIGRSSAGAGFQLAHVKVRSSSAIRRHGAVRRHAGGRCRIGGRRSRPVGGRRSCPVGGRRSRPVSRDRISRRAGAVCPIFGSCIGRRCVSCFTGAVRPIFGSCIGGCCISGCTVTVGTVVDVFLLGGTLPARRVAEALVSVFLAVGAITAAGVVGNLHVQILVVATGHGNAVGLVQFAIGLAVIALEETFLNALDGQIQAPILAVDGDGNKTAQGGGHTHLGHQGIGPVVLHVGVVLNQVVQAHLVQTIIAVAVLVLVKLHLEGVTIIAIGRHGGQRSVALAADAYILVGFAVDHQMADGVHLAGTGIQEGIPVIDHDVDGMHTGLVEQTGFISHRPALRDVSGCCGAQEYAGDNQRQDEHNAADPVNVLIPEHDCLLSPGSRRCS